MMDMNVVAARYIQMLNENLMGRGFAREMDGLSLERKGYQIYITDEGHEWNVGLYRAESDLSAVLDGQQAMMVIVAVHDLPLILDVVAMMEKIIG